MSFSLKRPIEQDYFGVDWTEELATGETIATAAVSVSVKKGVDPSASAIVSGSAAISGAVVSQLFIGGVSGVTYDTIWRIVTSRPRTLEESVPLIVE